MRNDNLDLFLHDWDTALLGLAQIPDVYSRVTLLQAGATPP